VKTRAGRGSRSSSRFDAQRFLDSAGVSRRIVAFQRSETVFSQGEPAESVAYIQRGTIKLAVVNAVGKEAVVAMLSKGDFVGEGCLAGQTRRIGTATAVTAATVLMIEKGEMIRVLQAEQAFSERFVAYVLTRNIRIEQDLIDQLFNSSEKRLARVLLLLGRYGKDNDWQYLEAKLSQETLAEMVGTTRSRVNFFMNKFRKLGFVEYNGGIRIHSSLLSVVLHE
jgi:CRP-like cAMP-binding protein